MKPEKSILVARMDCSAMDWRGLLEVFVCVRKHCHAMISEAICVLPTCAANLRKDVLTCRKVLTAPKSYHVPTVQKHAHPTAEKNVCGDDGCGGSCGSCVGEESCVSGSCSVVTVLGSCINPQPLFGESTLVPQYGIHDLFIQGDSSGGIDMTRPYCGIPGVPEYVYSFTVQDSAVGGMGFEIRLTCADGSNGCDTVLAVHDSKCQSFTLTAVDRLCSDDQTPPGNLASRVDGKLPPGNYTLVVTGYNTATVGPFMLQVKFTPACYPKCEGLFCGTDGCDGSCGSCDMGMACYFGRCRSEPCVPNCQAKTCGSDGCGGSCGVCKGSKVCDLQLGTCVPVSLCDNFIPNCPNMRNGNGPQDMFCGSDCEWHRLDTEAPDLTPNNYAEMLPSINMYWSTITSTSCAHRRDVLVASDRDFCFRSIHSCITSATEI